MLVLDIANKQTVDSEFAKLMYDKSEILIQDRRDDMLTREWIISQNEERDKIIDKIRNEIDPKILRELVEELIEFNRKSTNIL